MKLAIFVRTDLDMRKGKIAVQVGHASVIAFNGGCAYITDPWLLSGQKKIVLKALNEDTLENIERQAEEMDLPSYRVVDLGLTQIEPNTWTCLAVGPDEDEKIDEITKGYSLL